MLNFTLFSEKSAVQHLCEEAEGWRLHLKKKMKKKNILELKLEVKGNQRT